MPFNLLIFPLVGGYYFAVFCILTKDQNKIIDRQRLLFNSVIYGIFLLLFTYIVELTLGILFPGFVNRLKVYIPIDEPYAGTSIISFFISILTTHGVNLFVKLVPDLRSKILRNSIYKYGNELEKLIFEAFNEGSMLSITLSSNKVYVGIPIFAPHPNESSYIVILPILSGYRNERQDLIFTTSYEKFYSGVFEDMDNETSNKDGSVNLEFKNYIKTDNIVSVSEFDIELYDKYNQRAKM